ncbi:MAG: thiamine pyrophosphate-dependent enzyme [Candidatus Omnitrophota bacterium]
MSKKLYSMLRPKMMPHMLCRGCGHGIVINAVLRAILDLEIPLTECVLVSAAGCMSLATSPHIALDMLHGLRGLAVPCATGIKRANPALRVIVIGGEGDLVSLQTTHLVHAARKNIDITVICANNHICASNGGAASSTTPVGAITATTPKGNTQMPLDICKLLIGAGASYVARYSVAQPKALTRAIKVAIVGKNFAFVEALTMCPTEYGKRNNILEPVDMIKNLKISCMPGDISLGASRKGISDRIVIGEYGRK